MKLGLLAATLVLAAGGAVACGGDDGGDGGGSDDRVASTEDFCAAFQTFYEDVTSSEDREDLGKVLKDAAEKVEKVGVPKGIPDDAEAGLELTLDAIDDLPDGASEEDIAGLQQDYSEDDQAKLQAFNDYLSETCPDLGS